MLEALSCGTPVIATDSRGFKENARGENCLFFKRGDPQDLSKKLVNFFRGKFYFQKEAVKYCREYDIEKSSKELVSVYKMLKQNRKRNETVCTLE